MQRYRLSSTDGGTYPIGNFRFPDLQENPFPHRFHSSPAFSRIELTENGTSSRTTSHASPRRHARPRRQRQERRERQNRRRPPACRGGRRPPRPRVRAAPARRPLLSVDNIRGREGAGTPAGARACRRTGRTRTRAAGTWRWPGRRGWTTPWARWSGAWRGVDVHTAGRGTRRRMETRSVAPGRLGGPRGPAGGPAPAAGAGARRRGVRGHGVKVFIASILVVVLIQKFS